MTKTVLTEFILKGEAVEYLAEYDGLLIDFSRRWLYPWSDSPPGAWQRYHAESVVPYRMLKSDADDGDIALMLDDLLPGEWDKFKGWMHNNGYGKRDVTSGRREI